MRIRSRNRSSSMLWPNRLTKNICLLANASGQQGRMGNNWQPNFSVKLICCRLPRATLLFLCCFLRMLRKMMPGMRCCRKKLLKWWGKLVADHGLEYVSLIRVDYLRSSVPCNGTFERIYAVWRIEWVVQAPAHNALWCEVIVFK